MSELQQDPHVVRYALVDIDVTELSPTHACANVTYETADGGYETMEVVFYIGGTVGLIEGSSRHDEALVALRADIAAELRESCLYQRDLNRELN